MDHLPRTIRHFLVCYLAAIVIGIAGWGVRWRGLSQQLLADPRTAPFWWILPAAVAAVVMIELLLAYLVVQHASRAARVLVAILAAVGALRFAMMAPSFLAGGAGVPTVLVATAGTILSVTAAALLFTAGARGWFGDDDDDAGDDREDAA